MYTEEEEGNGGRVAARTCLVKPHAVLDTSVETHVIIKVCSADQLQLIIFNNVAIKWIFYIYKNKVGVLYRCQ